MPKEMFISSSPHETKVAVLEDEQLVEVYYERDTDVGLVGSIYKGRVSRVLPGMQSAFVDIGLERDAFLYVSDFFFEDQEEYDKVFEEAEARAARFTTEEAQVSAPPAQPSEVVGRETAPDAAAPTLPPEGEEPSTPQIPAAGHPGELPPAEAVATAGAAPGVVTPPAATAGETHEHRRFDRRGRRRRRRAPGFGEHPFGEHRFPPRQETPAPHTFEILPGESLAKYSHPASEVEPAETPAGAPSEGSGADSPVSPPEAGTSRESAPAERLTVEPSAIQAIPTAVEGAQAEVVAEQAVAPPPPREPVAAAAETPARVAEAPVTLSMAVQEAGAGPAESPAAYSVRSPAETAAVRPTGFPIPKEEPRASESSLPSPAAAPVTAASVGPEPVPPVEVAKTPAEPAQALPPELTIPSEAPSSPAPSPATPEQPLSEVSAPPSPGPPETSGASGERTYTLREPHQRPRFAPRRRRGRREMGQQASRQEGRREPSRPGNQQPVQISEVLKEGQEILVQIAKEPLGTKGARITSHIALPGRYLVYMPTIVHIGVSRKIISEEERLRLRNIILENKGPLAGGFIVRTAGQGRPEEEFKTDLKFLTTLWNEIRAKAERVKAPALIHRDLNLVQRLLRDLLTPDFKCVRMDGEAEYERVLEFVNRTQPSLVGKIKLYTRDAPLFEEFGVQAEIEKALKPKVWLKSGGYIVINQTEALVAVDVNTGKYVGKTNRLEDTIVKTNIDAVNEIVRQMRLRDLGGIIVIDFIDMDERKNRSKVVQALEEALRRDRAPTKVISFHDFGLVAITRKRVKQSLERTLCEPCWYCTGSGWVKSINSVCYEILAEARQMAKHLEGNVLTLRVNSEVAKALKSGLVSELEAATKKDVIVKGDPTVHQERFEIF